MFHAEKDAADECMIISVYHRRNNFIFQTTLYCFRKDPVRVVNQNILVQNFISCVIWSSEPVNVHIIHIM